MSYAGTFDSGVTLPLDTLTGNAGGVVSPDGASNIDILGSGIVTVTGTPASHLLTISVTNPIPVANGGTGASTLTDHGIMLGSGTGAVTVLGAATNGQLPIGSTGADPVLAALTAGNNIGITNAAGSITINVNGTTQYALQVGDATNSLDSLGLGSSGQVLRSAGAGAIPAWSTATYTGTSAQGDILYSSSANTIVGLTKDANATRYLSNTGASNNPAWAQVALSTGVSGTLPVGNGGTGDTTLLDHGVLIGSGSSAITALTVGTDGQVLLGSSTADPVFATLTSTGGTIAYTPGAGTLNLEISGVIANSFPTDSGTATPAAGVLTVSGGTNINTSGAAAAVTVNLDSSISAMAAIDMANAGRIGTTVNVGETYLLQAYDTLGTAYSTFATLTAGNPPTMDLASGVTIGTSYIYRAGGTDIPVADGGTGVSTLLDHGVLIGSGSSAITALTVGTDGQVLLGSSTADPVFATLTSTGGTVAFTPGAGTLNLETGSAVTTSAPTDSGTATPSSGALTFTGGDNIDTSGAGSTVTIAVSSAVCDSAATDSGTATPAAGVLTFAGGTNVTTSGAGSTVTINASGGGGGITWAEVTGTTQAMAIDTGYIANNASPVVFTLPDTAALGSVLRVTGKGAGGWKIEQNAGESIIWDESTATTTGVTGYLESTDDYDSVELICLTADTTWGILSSKGNITVS